MNACCLPFSFGRFARALFAVTCLLLLMLFSGVDARAQALAGMPTVEQVKTVIKGSDETDTLARQLAVFEQLMQYITRIKTSRTVRGPYTPEEQKLYQDYGLAASQISQNYQKTHTVAETQAFSLLHNRYELLDDNFERDWRKQLLGPQATATYNAALGNLAAGQQRHNQEITDQNKQAMDRAAAGGADPDDPTGVAIRRCLELGGNSLSCVAKGMNTGMLSLIGLGSSIGGMDTSKMTGPGRAGVVLHGMYQRPGEKTSLEFSIDKVAIAGCGSLDAFQTAPTYTLERQPGSVRIVVNNSPKSFTLTLGPDGGLTGPGMVDVTGQTIVGWTTQTTQVYKNGVSVGQGVAAECGGFCRNTTQSPIYQVKTERCSIGSYKAPPPLPPAHDAKADEARNSPAGMIAGLVTYTNGGAEAMDNADAPRGLRMNGLYSDGRMRLQFTPTAVVVDCGQSHVLVPYTVENTPERFLVHVANTAGGPFTLAIEPDNSLRGSGSTTVNGRLISGMQGQNVAFSAHSETCSLGTLRPNTGSGESMKIAGAATPPPSATPAGMGSQYAAYSPAPVLSAASSANTPAAMGADSAPAGRAPGGMRVLMSSTFPQGANPVSGQVVWLMHDRMDAVLRTFGAPIPPNATPGQAWLAFGYWCKNPGNDCTPLMRKLGTYLVAQTSFDGSGRATISSQTAAPGRYYLFALVNSPNGALLWDLPADLHLGDNSITFTAQTAENMRDVGLSGSLRFRE